MRDFETFYAELKDALEFLGLKWGDKHMATVYVEGDELVVTYRKRSVKLNLAKS